MQHNSRQYPPVHHTASWSALAQRCAVAPYQRPASEAAEIALAVEECWQEHDIVPQLLRTLATYARGRGFTTLIAEVTGDTDRVLATLCHADSPTAMRLRDGRIEERRDISGISNISGRDRACSRVRA